MGNCFSRPKDIDPITKQPRPRKEPPVVELVPEREIITSEFGNKGKQQHTDVTTHRPVNVPQGQPSQSPQRPEPSPPPSTPAPKAEPPKVEHAPSQLPARPSIVVDNPPIIDPTPPSPKITPITPKPLVAPPPPFQDPEPPKHEEDIKRNRKIEIFEQMFKSDVVVGYLEKDRLRALLEQMRIYDPAVHEFLWKQYDVDGDGKVNFQEFCQMMFDVMDIKKNFEAADLNHDKSISSTEIVTVLNKLNIIIDSQTIDMIMNLFDTNHDKGIDFSEFLPLSIFLTTLEYQYKEFINSRTAKTKWIRPIVGGDIKKEEEIARELEDLIKEQREPSMDAFVRIILTAASSNGFKDCKAPSVAREEKEKTKRPMSIIKPAPSKANINLQGPYEDPEFVPGPDILPARLADKIVWRRPAEINPERHELFVDGVEEGDVIQGSLGDCWFLGALAVAASSRNSYIKDLFVQMVPEHGYYVVKFFKDGAWINVTVDDRLPCHMSSKGGYIELAFATCKDRSEFWVPIVEKAYAKLHGSYESLEGGSICDALKDLTGGAIETLRWKPEENDVMWDRLRMLTKQKSLMGCSIDSADDVPESKLDCGLLQNHAYSILKCKIAEREDGTFVRLLRVRNPWGEGEWNGAWSDGAAEWNTEMRHKKFVREYTFKDDGTFFMSFEDFVQYFNRIFVMRSSYSIPLWSGKGQWKGENAQGCRNNPYWLNNPQYAIKTTEPNTKIFVNLSQPDWRYELKQNPGSHKREYESIGLYILKANDRRYKKMVCRDEDKAGSSAFTGVRDTSLEFDCAQPGIYILVPCTYHAQKEAKYNITLYTIDGKLVEVVELPAKKSVSLNGEWKLGSTAGGCYPNYRATFMNNPQFLLKCDSADNVDILLAQQGKGPNGYEPVGVYAFPANNDQRHEKNNRFVLRPEEMLEAVSVSASLNVDPEEGYILIPANMDPVDGKFAITVISDHVKVFKAL